VWEMAYAAVAGAASQDDAIAKAQELLRGVYAGYMVTCLAGSNTTCRRNMETLIEQFRGARVTVTMLSLFEPIRNNMFFYRVAPHLRLAVTISKSARDCSGWIAEAARSGGATLPQLLDAAGQEIGERRSSPEARELDALRVRFAGCGAGSGAD
jgi:hypothetical protein